MTSMKRRAGWVSRGAGGSGAGYGRRRSGRRRRSRSGLTRARTTSPTSSGRGDRRAPRRRCRHEGDAPRRSAVLAGAQPESGGRPVAAVATISRLEREYPTSMWVRPAQSLRIEIAVRLQPQRRAVDTVAPPLPPPAPGVPPALGGSADAVAATCDVPAGAAGAPGSAAPEAAAAAQRPYRRRRSAVPPKPPPPPPMWYSESIGADDDLRIQALGGLLRSEPQRVVPMLGEIALESDEPELGEPRRVRAGAVVAAGGARDCRQGRQAGSEPVQIAAVRDLGRFGGPDVSNDLMQVYVTAQPPVKAQIVKSLGERSEQLALATIVAVREGRPDPLTARSSASGRRAAADQLAAMYQAASPATSGAIIGGLVLRAGGARADPHRRSRADPGRSDVPERRPRAAAAARARRRPGSYLQKVSEERGNIRKRFTNPGIAGRRARR